MLINLTVVITALHIHVSKHHIVHPKYIQFLSVTWTSKRLGRKKLPSTLTNSELKDTSFFPSKLNFLGKQSIPQSSCLHLFASSLLQNLLEPILKRHKDLFLSNPVFIVLFWIFNTVCRVRHSWMFPPKSNSFHFHNSLWLFPFYLPKSSLLTDSSCHFTLLILNMCGLNGLYSASCLFHMNNDP